MSDDRSSALRLVTPPASEPVTLAQAKTFLRIEHAADDEPITRAIAAARHAAEYFLSRALLPRTYEFIRANPTEVELALPFGPATSITSVTLTNEAGVDSVVNASNYRLAVDGHAVLFEPAITAAKITIRYIAAMAATPAELPPLLVQGILHHVATMLEQRDGSIPMPMQSLACYQPFRRIAI